MLDNIIPMAGLISYANTVLSNTVLAGTIGNTTGITGSSYSSTYGTAQVEKNSFKNIVIDGNVIINGEPLEDRLSRIETVLNIPVRDIPLETKYQKLRELWLAYTNELEKYKTWEKLNNA